MNAVLYSSTNKTVNDAFFLERLSLLVFQIFFPIFLLFSQLLLSVFTPFVPQHPNPLMLECLPPPKFICWSPNPQYFRVWPYLETGFYRGNQVKMRSLTWALIQYDPCPYKKGNFGDTDTQGQHHVRTDRDLGDASINQRLPAKHQMPGRDIDQMLPHSVQKEPTTLMPWIQTFASRTTRQ